MGIEFPQMLLKSSYFEYEEQSYSLFLEINIVNISNLGIMSEKMILYQYVNFINAKYINSMWNKMITVQLCNLLPS